MYSKKEKKVLTSKAESAFDRKDGNNRTMYIDQKKKGPTTSIACSNHSGLVLTLPRQLPKETYCLLGVRILQWNTIDNMNQCNNYPS